MAMFNSYVKLPEGSKMKVVINQPWWTWCKYVKYVTCGVFLLRELRVCKSGDISTTRFTCTFETLLRYGGFWHGMAGLIFDSLSKFKAITGLWFGSFFIFHILGIIIPTDQYVAEGWLNHQPDKDQILGLCCLIFGCWLPNIPSWFRFVKTTGNI